MNNKSVVLILGIVLLAIGVLKPDLSNIGFPNKPVPVDVLELTAPSDEDLKKEADDVVSLLKQAGPQARGDARRLRDLILDIRKLVELDGENEVIKNTEEIRQANSLAGVMLRMDIKGKYADLAKECKEVIVAAIGDDQIVLTPALRAKALDGFNGLS